tara:strand:- start:83 stop:568 length:486 start_codon:yes stop_codon:yes gene_type:complete
MKIRKNGKVINLTESDLKRIVKKVLTEDSNCGNESPSFDPSIFKSGSHPPIEEFESVGKSMEVPSGKYTLIPVSNERSIYYVYDSSKCWTGYCLSGGREWDNHSDNKVKAGETITIDYKGGVPNFPNEFLPFGHVWEVYDNKYSTSPNTDGPNSGKIIRSN